MNSPMVIGWYYLHTNGSLIYKPGSSAAEYMRESDFVMRFWAVDPTDRAGAWRILVEGLALGAEPERVQELARLWGCNEADAVQYAQSVGCNIHKDGSKWCATDQEFTNLQEGHAGFGVTPVEAFADLAKSLGFCTTSDRSFLGLLRGHDVG